jgi:pimeloyl-ACP methyl ester carboxylesterase
VLGPVLRQAGFRVVVFNAPGHHSAPRRSSLPAFSEGLRNVEELFGADVLIGHSFGAMTVTRVARELPDLKAIALFSTPNELLPLALGYCHKLNMDEVARTEFLQTLADNTPDPLDRETVSHYLKSVECPVIFFHDEDDDVIAASASKALASQTESELVITEGLGHRRIIRSEKLASRAADFLKAQL